MKRTVALLPVLIALQVGVQPALAWTWPVDGPVLRPFVLGEDPYAAGQHRGIDVGAASGVPVRAPAAGVASFAGSVPGGGRTVTIQTDDGYSVTLVHLGSVGVSRTAVVGEGDTVGAIGPSGTPEHGQPYVHLGVRLSADEHAYLDPLSLLPARAPEGEPPSAPAPQTVQQPLAGADEPAGPAAPETAAAKPSRGKPEPAESTQTGSGPAAESAPVAGARSSARSGLRKRPARDGARGASPTASVPKAVQAPRGRPGLALGSGRAGRRQADGQVQSLPTLEAAGSARTRRESFEPPGQPAVTPQQRQAASPHAGLDPGVIRAAALGAALGALAVLVSLRVRRRQLVDARLAHRPAAVFLDDPPRPAEHAVLPRPVEEDRVALDRDLERVLLGEAESLPDLDRNHDPAQLVHVANDPRSSHSLFRAQRCAHRCNSPRRFRVNRVGVR
jgi:Peptidase family M23